MWYICFVSAFVLPNSFNTWKWLKIALCYRIFVLSEFVLTRFHCMIQHSVYIISYRLTLLCYCFYLIICYRLIMRPLVNSRVLFLLYMLWMFSGMLLSFSLYNNVGLIYLISTLTLLYQSESIIIQKEKKQTRIKF